MGVVIVNGNAPAGARYLIMMMMMVIVEEGAVLG